MKKLQSFGILAPLALAAALVLSLAFTACGGDGDPTSPAGDPALTGTVTITGTAEVGATLTAVTTALDGTGTLSYQWIADTTDISGAIGATYSPVAGDVGKTIKVQVSRAGNSGTITSLPTSAIVAAGSPALTGTVTITGTPQVGQTLTADTAALDGTGTLSYQWIADTTAITGATGTTYSPVAGDVGKTIKVQVSRAGNSGTITSLPTSAIVAADSPALTGAVTITGTAEVGATLTADTTALDGTGTLSYQWIADTTAITGATGATYVPVADDVGKTIKVQVSRAGYSGSVTSAATAAVTAAIPALTGTVTITGTAEVGETLTADTSTLDGTGTLSYQWIVDTTDITGATGATYVPVAADETKTIKVAVSRAGYTGTVTSAATAAVAAVTPTTALWAKSTTAGTNRSTFNSVAKDSAGNIYVVGTQNRVMAYEYGPGVSVTGTAGNENAVLVKYNSSGVALWAKTVTAGTSATTFTSVAVDGAGNVYAAGYKNSGATTYGGSVVVTTTAYISAVLVKYDSSGDVQWAKSVTATDVSQFKSVAVDSTGNVYAAGYQSQTGSYDYGNSITVAGGISGDNAVLVKYNSSGDAQWAKTVTAGAVMAVFESVAVDNAGNVYAAGNQLQNSSYDYGNGVTVTGTADNLNAVLVKYDSSGATQWAKTVTAGTEGSSFSSVALDSAGNVYTVGNQVRNMAYEYGPGVSVAGTSPSSANAVLVKYNPSGAAQWAKTVTAGTISSYFYSVAVDSAGNVYAAGYQNGNSSIDYGSSVLAQGAAASNNVVLVKYNSSGTAQWAKTVTAGASGSQFNSIAVDNVGGVYAAGTQNSNGLYEYGTGVSATGTTTGGYDPSAVLVKYQR
ncbi:hypothetical protein AGMMS50267_06190 [Spirochaetia bacterium]|nr:hypothetical protein AGMMS50267_06190 [Spirochaetia bacterium]